MQIRIKNLKFSYQLQKPVLDIAEFEVTKNQKVFIFGPSGSGKTTLLGLLTGVLPVSDGSIQILGQDIGKLSGSQRDQFRGDHIGYIFQMFNLIPYLNVRDNILLSAWLSNKRRQKCQKFGGQTAHMNMLAEGLGIFDLLDKKVTELSVGQQQRVAAARALLGCPEVLIADEPTSALDYDHREKFLKVLFEQCHNTESTLIFVSHDRQLQSLFDRSVSLSEINRARGAH